MEKGRAFSDILRDAQAKLTEIVDQGTGSVIVGTDVLVAQLYEAGRAVGLTPKEITQALVRIVRDQLRPSLRRP